ncbi:MAG: hypothetical protein ACRDKY_12260 [Solirubrobacteraceae bacterium]
MPEIGSNALEVALGLVFIYLIFSLVCSAVLELVSSFAGWRAENLERGLRQLLHGELPGGTPAFDALLSHPRIQELTIPEKLRKSRPLPSYISSRTFSLTLLDTIAPPGAEADSKDLVARAQAKVDDLPDSELKRKLASMLDAGGDDIGRLRTEIEHWYDDAMNRVSGWYRRKSQFWLLLFSVVIVAAANVDTIEVVDRLWNDKTARVALVAQAEQVQPAQNADELDQIVGDLELDLPLGWAHSDTVDGLKLLGLLLSALAIAQGAPFWFDALNKVGRLRATGKPEGRAPGSANP